MDGLDGLDRMNKMDRMDGMMGPERDETPIAPAKVSYSARGAKSDIFKHPFFCTI